MKFIDNIKEKVTGLKKVSGISLSIVDNENWEISQCILENTNGILKVVTLGAQSFIKNEIAALKKQDIPVILSIDGRGVIHKKVVARKNEGDSNLLNKAIPNAEIKDFYLQTYDLDNQYYVSIARKEIIDAVLKVFNEEGIAVIDVILGPFVSSVILPIIELNDETNYLFSRNHKIIIAGGVISDVSKESAPNGWKINIDGQEVNDEMLLPYATALSAYLPCEKIEGLKLEQTLFAKSEWEQKQIFQISSKVALIGIFGLLLINFMFFMQFSKTNSQLNNEYSINQANLTKLKTLKKELRDKKKFLKSIGWSGHSKVAYYADRLAVSLPKEINWEELEVFPVDEEVLRKDKRHIFKNNLIVIRGKSNGPIILNQWISDLDKLDWINQIRDQEYSYDIKSKQGKFQFNIELKGK